MYCVHCGKPNQAKSRFCEFCGQSLENCDESLSRISGVNAASQSASKPSNRFKQQVRPYLPIVVSLFAALLFVGGALVYAYAMSQGHEAEEAVSDVAVPAEEDASASESADVSKNDATSGAESLRRMKQVKASLKQLSIANLLEKRMKAPLVLTISYLKAIAGIIQSPS